MPNQRAVTNTALYCDACQLIFRIPPDAFGAGTVVSVACPTCGRQARVEKLSDGSHRIAHKGQIFICPRPLAKNPLAVVLVYVGAFAAVALAFTAVARLVHWMLCPVVLIATLVAIGMIGATQLAMQGELSRSYVDLMRIFYKGLPYLLFRSAPEGNVVPESPGAAAPAATPR